MATCGCLFVWLRGAALFYDAQVEYAERLAVENALDAKARGAAVLTYARVERLLVEGEAVCGVVFRDTLGGATHEARANVVLNAAGPWVDEVLEGSPAERETDRRDEGQSRRRPRLRRRAARGRLYRSVG